MPIGAEILAGGVHFRVWAPRAQRLAIQVDGTRHAAIRENGGYWSAFVAGAGAGSLYGFFLNEDERVYPDPASRFQPDGPHGPSLVIDPDHFQWSDSDWRGLSLERQVLYEFHVGTFTSEGSWRAAADKLPLIRDVGITCLEMMPVAEFSGRFGWGYDGVSLFAPTRLYGNPDDLRFFIDRAHALGLGVILDVVYNHFGPDGNYLPCFSDTYLTRKYDNEWGDAINFDDEGSQPVREFVCENAAYWIREFHFDGLRLDATQQMFDASDEHIVSALARAARVAAGKRQILIVAENEPQDSRLVRPEAQGGYGLDAIWNDDFHHTAHVTLTARAEAYYSDYTGSARELLAAARHGFLYQGQRSTWQHKPRGHPSLNLPPRHRVNFLENHDQIANSGRGARLVDLADASTLRAMTTLMLLMPGTPMFFQGQEFAARTPFLYFADHAGELGKAVAQGRREFLLQFQSLQEVTLDAPGAEETFRKCILDWSQRETSSWALALHRDLLRLRREDPVLSLPNVAVDGATLTDEALLLRFFGGSAGDRLLLVNVGRDYVPPIMPEPLLAPPQAAEWQRIFSSEEPRYGGNGVREPLTKDGHWCVQGRAAGLLASVRKQQ